MSETLLTTVTGGYNGGAVISIKLDNTEVFTATAPDTYNQNYNNTSGSFTSVEVGEINISITPPPTTTSALTIVFSGGISRTLSVTPNGVNTSYGYNFSDSYTIGTPVPPPPAPVLDKPMIQVKFTDGTSWYMFNDDVPMEFLGREVYQLICANCYIYNESVINGFSYNNADVTKTDYDGNTWRFVAGYYSCSIYINNIQMLVTNYNTDTHFALLYKPSTNKIRTMSFTSYSQYIGGFIGLPNEWSNSNLGQWTEQYVDDNGTSSMPTLSESIVNIYNAPNQSGVNLAAVGNHSPKPEIFGSTAYGYKYYKNNSTGYPYIGYAIDYRLGTEKDITFTSQTVSNYDPVEPLEGIDPYEEAGDSTTGGGGGSWDNGSDPVGIPSLPSVGATNTGFITLFVPTQSQLKQVAEYLWGGLFDISTYLRLFEDPMDCILGLSVVPVSVPTSGSATITVGNIELSGISLPVASQQYIEVDCGSLTVDPYFGSYLDYEPYTKMSLFVPYSGVHTVNADDIMGRTVNLVYHIDILTGSLVAFLKCGDSVLYEFNGACGSNIPVNSMNYASTIENAIRIAVNIGTTVATAGASAPLTGADAGKRTAYQEFGRGVSLAGSTADGALSLKPNIDRAGSLGGTTGLLGNQIPYFIVTRPRLCKPKNQNKIKGYPAFINYSVSDLVCKGYTEFDTILLKNLYLTDDEKNELESILEGGVYL